MRTGLIADDGKSGQGLELCQPETMPNDATLGGANKLGPQQRFENGAVHRVLSVYFLASACCVAVLLPAYTVFVLTQSNTFSRHASRTALYNAS